MFRINIFDIVTQYLAIFPALEISHETDVKNRAHSKIINSWLLLKIEQYLNILKLDLNALVDQNSIIYIDSWIANCFYFGLSMSKIGADIRPQLILLFNSFIAKRFQHCVEKSNQRFSNSLNNFFTKKVKETQVMF